MSPESSRTTTLLQRLHEGEQSAAEELLPLIYSELRRVADRYMKNERDGHTLQPTALVHEAYLKLIDRTRADGAAVPSSYRDRVHFFATVAQMSRHILVDHARARNTLKRRDGRRRVPLDPEMRTTIGGVDLIELDDALARLATLDSMQARIVELRFFGGLTLAEIADVLDTGRRSVDRQWSRARAWLKHTLSSDVTEIADEAA